MKNERGNAIALVLLILAVVSLVGAGALMMSRHDLRFSHALRSYDMGFNLADGAATISYRDLAKHDREQSLSLKADYETNTPNPKTVFCQCTQPGNCCTSSEASCPRCVDRAAGNYYVNVQIVDYRTSLSNDGAGWEAGSYYNENWNGQGVAQRAPGKTGAYATGNACVQANILKKKQTGH
jgi:Tfp pilus assembly protein PilX